MANTGYSGTPLAKKLGIKSGYKVRLVNHPGNYFSLFDDMPAGIVLCSENKSKKDLVHYFTTNAEELQQDLPSLKNEITADGILWISWPKKASKISTNITENLIRHFALANRLVDVKACAVDENMVGLKISDTSKKPGCFKKVACRSRPA